MEFGRHVLLLGYFLHRFVVHEDLKSFLVYAQRSGDHCGLNIDLHGNTTDKGFDRSVHDVHSAEVIILGLFTSDSGLHEEACDYTGTKISILFTIGASVPLTWFEHGLRWRLICLIDAQGLDPPGKAMIVAIGSLHLGRDIGPSAKSAKAFQISCCRLRKASPFTRGDPAEGGRLLETRASTVTGMY